MSSEMQACVDFLQRLVRTPSLPGAEGEVADLVRDEMQELGYTDVRIDEVGNVLGRVPGRGDGPAVMFNTHLDHVDVGDPGRWPHPPFGAEIHGGAVWGRGTVDIKGPLAAQVYGVARLLEEETEPAGDVWVTAVVQEEIGGVGARHLVGHLAPPLVVVGEPTSNGLRRGHRGRSEIVLHVRGRSVHASVPETGINPYFVVSRFLSGIPDLEMTTQEDLGSSSVAPTLIRTDQTSGNVVPGEIWLTCDWRHVPGETAEQARLKLQALADASLVEGATAEVRLPVVRRRTWTGVEIEMQGNNPAYILPADHPALAVAADLLTPVLGTEPPVDTWRFATDGGHFSEAGCACIGFGPGDEGLAHTVDEHLELPALEAAVAGNAALAAGLGAGLGAS